MRAGLCSLLVLVLLSLAASLPLEEDEAPTAEDEEEIYDDEAGEGEEVEYGFHPLDEFPETISVPVTEETDGGAPTCAPDSIALCLCSDGTLPPCPDDIAPECTCHKKSSLDVKGVEEEEEPQDSAVQEEIPTTTLPTTSTSPTTITSSTAASTTTEASESVPTTTESTPSSSPSNEPSLSSSEPPVESSRPQLSSSEPPADSSRPQLSSSEPPADSSRPQLSEEADSVSTSSGDGPVVPSPASAPLPPAAPGLRRPGSHVPLRPFVPGQRRPFPQAAAGGEVTPSDVEPTSGHHQLSPGGHLGQAADGPNEKHPSVETSSLPPPPPPPVEEPIEPLLPGQPTSFCEDGTLARCDRRCLNGAPLPCAPGNEPSCFCRDGSTPARATPVLSQRLRPAAADSGRPGSDQPLNLSERFKPSRLSSSAEFTAARDATLY
jgi:hypothetical protein